MLSLLVWPKEITLSGFYCTRHSNTYSKKSRNPIFNTISATNAKTVEPKRRGCKTKKAILIALSVLLVIAILASALAAYFLLFRPKSENKFENADRFENDGKNFT
jgi:hypothetical protein